MFTSARRQTDILTPREWSAPGWAVLSTAGRGAQLKHRLGFSHPCKGHSSAGTQLGEV